MQIILVWHLLYIIISAEFSRFVYADCSRDYGPPGSPECVLLEPLYSKYQWATCLSNQYIQTYSKGKHICRDNTATFCYYQCMIEIYNDEGSGPVYDDCVCGVDAPQNATSESPMTTPAIPEWCYSPAGDDCSWYRKCLEKRYPCKQQGRTSYALDFAEKFCKLYDMHYSEFDRVGQQWIDGVRKCLQVKLVPILRPFVHKTCQQIKQFAYSSHPGCYLNPDAGKPSICDIGTYNWLRVFWTIKSAFNQELRATFKQMFIVGSTCATPSVSIYPFIVHHMNLIRMKVEHVVGKIKHTIDETLDDVSKSISEQMQWRKNGILHFIYSTPVIQNRKRRSDANTTNTSYVHINVLMTSQSLYDLNDQNNITVNVSEAAHNFAYAVERGDVQIDVGEGMKFTELSICVDFNCTETSLQVIPAPPPMPPKEQGDHRGVSVVTVVIIVCSIAFGIVLITALAIVLRKTNKC